MFANIWEWLSRRAWLLLGLPPIEGVLADPLHAWLAADWPEQAEFVRGRGSVPHWLALMLCALSFFVLRRIYAAMARPAAVKRSQRTFGILTLVLLAVSANFLYLDIPETWASPEITSLRIQITFWTYLVGYICLGGTLAEK